MVGSMGTGSDTRMYGPRSESTHMYTGADEDYRHGIGDPKAMEEYRDKLMREKEAIKNVNDLPHLKVEVDAPPPPPPQPMAPPMSPDADQPVMDDSNENAVGAEVSQMTGMPDMGNLSVGNATGTMPAPGGTLMTGEPMDNAWSSLLKDRASMSPTVYSNPVETSNPLQSGCDNCRGKILSEPCLYCNSPASPLAGTSHDNAVATGEPMELAWRLLKKDGEPWAQPQYESEMREKEKLSTKHGKMSESSLPHAREHGLDRSPLSVHYGHRGKGRLRPLTLEPEKYAQYQGQRQLRSLMGGISMPKTIMGRSPSGERDMHIPSEPAPPKQLAIQAPKVPHDVKPPKIKDMTIKSMREDISDIKKKMNYMEFNQLRRLLRRLKGKVDDREQALKAHAAPGENNEMGHRDGGTTAPHGPTENIEQEEFLGERTGRIFAAPGSGRTP